MKETTRKCLRCYRELPIQKFYKDGVSGTPLKTCDDCRGHKQVLREKRTCPGLPKSWGFPKCEAEVDRTYRCATCDRIWKIRHGVIDGSFNGQEYGAAGVEATPYGRLQR